MTMEVPSASGVDTQKEVQQASLSYIDYLMKQMIVERTNEMKMKEYLMEQEFSHQMYAGGLEHMASLLKKRSAEDSSMTQTNSNSTSPLRQRRKTCLYPKP